MIRRPPRSTLFPYTTLFRSVQGFEAPLDVAAFLQDRGVLGRAVPEAGALHLVIDFGQLPLELSLLKDTPGGWRAARRAYRFVAGLRRQSSETPFLSCRSVSNYRHHRYDRHERHDGGEQRHQPRRAAERGEATLAHDAGAENSLTKYADLPPHRAVGGHHGGNAGDRRPQQRPAVLRGAETRRPEVLPRRRGVAVPGGVGDRHQHRRP